MGVTLSLNNYAPFGMTFSLVVNSKPQENGVPFCRIVKHIGQSDAKKELVTGSLVVS